MASEISELMHSSLFRVFAERDPERRKAAMAGIYTEDVVFHDPDGTVAGQAALAEKAQALLDSSPGLVFQPVGQVRESGDLGLLAWQLGPDGGPPVATGMDIALVRGGRIGTLYTLVDS